jgi:hypothetical protein
VSDEVYPPEAKLGIFEAMVAETDILVSLDPNVPGVLLPPKLMTDGPVTIKVSLAADPEIVCDADGFVYEMPMGFQAVIPWESVFRLAELDQPENQAWWEADDPATKEFMSAFDESFGD